LLGGSSSSGNAFFDHAEGDTPDDFKVSTGSAEDVIDLVLFLPFLSMVRPSRKVLSRFAVHSFGRFTPSYVSQIVTLLPDTWSI
jgi:hypothetical protein